jgi:hypothetical protein
MLANINSKLVSVCFEAWHRKTQITKRNKTIEDEIRNDQARQTVKAIWEVLNEHKIKCLFKKQ